MRAKASLTLLALSFALQGEANRVAALTLVTPEEAARPDAAPPQLRGIFPGPAIKLDLPGEQAVRRPLRSPLHLKIEFAARNQAKVDPTSAKLVYLKSPAADLTPRVRSSITESGIDLSQVNLPRGKHTFLISVLDSKGNRGMASYTITIAQ